MDDDAATNTVRENDILMRNEWQDQSVIDQSGEGGGEKAKQTSGNVTNNDVPHTKTTSKCQHKRMTVSNKKHKLCNNQPFCSNVDCPHLLLSKMAVIL